MAIDFSFNKGVLAAGKAAAASQEKPKAQFWLNIGYVAEGTAKPEEGKDDMFVSLPIGIPLDTMELLKTNSSNPEFNDLQGARNDLLSQILEHAKATLKPGEDLVFNIQGQIRRVKDETPPNTGAANKFAAKLSFA